MDLCWSGFFGADPASELGSSLPAMVKGISAQPSMFIFCVQHLTILQIRIQFQIPIQH
jgi:hypothetical protein